MSELSKNFAARLNEVCDEMGIPAKGHGRLDPLGKQFGVSQMAAQKWLVGDGWPAMENLIAICEWAQVRMDWLCHGKGDKYMAKPEKLPRTILAENIKTLMAKKKMSQTDISMASAITQAQVSRIIREKIETGIDVLYGFAKVFGVEPWHLLVPGLDPANLPVLQLQLSDNS